MEPIVIPSSETDKTLGKLEAKVDYLEKSVSNMDHKLDDIQEFLAEAKGAKKAIIGMWFIAGALGSAVTYFANHFISFMKQN